jgi:hypothetical protein
MDQSNREPHMSKLSSRYRVAKQLSIRDAPSICSHGSQQLGQAWLHITSTAVPLVPYTHSFMGPPNVCFPKGPCGSSRPKLCRVQTIDWGAVLVANCGTRPRNGAVCSIVNLVMTNCLSNEAHESVCYLDPFQD